MEISARSLVSQRFEKSHRTISSRSSMIGSGNHGKWGRYSENPLTQKSTRCSSFERNESESTFRLQSSMKRKVSEKDLSNHALRNLSSRTLSRTILIYDSSIRVYDHIFLRSMPIREVPITISIRRIALIFDIGSRWRSMDQMRRTSMMRSV